MGFSGAIQNSVQSINKLLLTHFDLDYSGIQNLLYCCGAKGYSGVDKNVNKLLPQLQYLVLLKRHS